MMELRGDIPGLLRRCSPLVDPSDGERSVVVSVVEGIGVRCSVERDCRVESYNYTFRSLCLDTSDPTGRFHARLWLLEQGHDVGSEDRAEVLAWSVLSVWRGGKPLRDVVGKARAGADTAQQAVEDAALLARGLALTNPDGSLTLPPLPGAP